MNEERNEQQEQSHLLRNITVLFSLIAIVVTAVIVLRGAGRETAEVRAVDPGRETVQTVSASPAMDAPLTKSQETLERKAGPAVPYEDPEAVVRGMLEDIREKDTELLAQTPSLPGSLMPMGHQSAPAEAPPEPQPQGEGSVPPAAPAPEQQQVQPAPAPAPQQTLPAPAPVPAPQQAQPAPAPAPAPEQVPVISEEAEDFCITDGVTY
ncbi:MAG: hypothetical protein IJP92_02420 [Lachnospiraceae bacterium]|nr:hypothetical protein [Lachnospiraceae bacterium]